MLSKVMGLSKKAFKVPGAFIGGMAVGSVGLKLLASKEAKQAYAKVIAKTFKVKDEIQASVSSVKQHFDDVIEDANDIYAAEKKEANLKLIEGE